MISSSSRTSAICPNFATGNVCLFFIPKLKSWSKTR
ncbi:RpiR family transcriptional regulator [Listeria monocytogenes]|nr:RpiR family transcriptional regulator [Listeria monocytogenes]